MRPLTLSPPNLDRRPAKLAIRERKEIRPHASGSEGRTRSRTGTSGVPMSLTSQSWSRKRNRAAAHNGVRFGGSRANTEAPQPAGRV